MLEQYQKTKEKKKIDLGKLRDQLTEVTRVIQLQVDRCPCGVRCKIENVDVEVPLDSKWESGDEIGYNGKIPGKIVKRGKIKRLGRRR